MSLPIVLWRAAGWPFTKFCASVIESEPVEVREAGCKLSAWHAVQGKVDEMPACKLCFSLNAFGRMLWVEREHLWTSLILGSMGSHYDVFQCLLGRMQFRKVLNGLTLELLKIIQSCCMGLRDSPMAAAWSTCWHKAVGLGKELIIKKIVKMYPNPCLVHARKSVTLQKQLQDIQLCQELICLSCLESESMCPN